MTEREKELESELAETRKRLEASDAAIIEERRDLTTQMAGLIAENSAQGEAIRDQESEIDSLRKRLEEVEAELRIREGLPVIVQSAVSGLWYTNPAAAGDISAIKLGDRTFVVGTKDADKLVALHDRMVAAAPHTEELGEVCTDDCKGCHDPLHAILEMLTETRLETWQRGRQIEELKDEIKSLRAEVEEAEAAFLKIRVALGLDRDSNDNLLDVIQRLREENERLAQPQKFAERSVTQQFDLRADAARLVDEDD